MSGGPRRGPRQGIHGAAVETRAPDGAHATRLLRTETVSIDVVRGFARDRRLYAVLDACDAPAVPQKARELGLGRAVSLYRGSAEEMYWAIAPYLFVVDEALLEWIVETLWDEPFGIFAVAHGGLDEVRRHFRRFLVVQAPNGEQWYFRYYDPRVLKTFLPTCTQDEINEIFGPIESFGIPAEEAGTVMLASVSQSRVRVRMRHGLSSSPAGDG